MWTMSDFNRTVTVCGHRRLARGYEFYFFQYKRRRNVEKFGWCERQHVGTYGEREVSKRRSVSANRRQFFASTKMFTATKPGRKGQSLRVSSDGALLQVCLLTAPYFKCVVWRRTTSSVSSDGALLQVQTQIWKSSKSDAPAKMSRNAHTSLWGVRPFVWL
jgi:hypothetical protein